MSHDKIRAAARKRMAETGEPYATARREVIKDYQQAGAAPRQPSALFLRSKVSSLTISLVDPDGFIAAVEGK
jgi:hypothetical protein